MFQQELYNEPSTVKTQEGDLFHNYEIKNWELGPRVYKILAASVILNLAAIGFIAQTDLLARKGCDSPWAGRVCQVLDMAYVGTMLFGTEREYVDKEYEKIDLGDSDITFIDASNIEPRFSYPSDYDKYANPEKYAAEQAAAQNPISNYTDSFPNPTTNDLLSKAPVLPKPNNDAVVGVVPDSPFSIGDSANTPMVKRGRNRPGVNRPPVSNSNTDLTTAQNDSNTNSNTNTAISTDPVAAVEINKRPMAELGNTINAIREKGQLNLESEFVVNGIGKLDKTGKLDPKTFRYVKAAGTDEALVNVVKDSIEAINEAGYLAYIKDIIGKELNFTFQQDKENIQAVFQSDLDNDSLAKQRKTSLDLLIALAKQQKQGQNASADDKDDLILLDGVKTEAIGKKLVITFVVPKAIAHPMIQRKLAEQAAEMKKPNGIANIAGPSETSAK